MNAREELDAIGGAPALLAWADAHREERPDWFWEFAAVMSYGTRIEIERFTDQTVASIRAWQRSRC